MNNIPGVLEHLLFDLTERKIEFTIKFFDTKDGFEKNEILVHLVEENHFIKLVKNPQRITYYHFKKGDKKKQISKEKILEKIKSLNL